MTRLVGLTEIADLANVSRQLVDAWRERHDDFPAPLTTIKAGPIFDIAEVRAWLINTGRMTKDGKPIKRRSSTS